ncbi:D-glycero-beta-D-manno-heptose 1-phosphate adenylyltransferase [Paramicrobacterium agarici]|uniref:D-glycero-beta-D-manno-heptose 1-phosphate adenylyltransferase n=1 Tax=Paramicrobacterium agarici TaxID=630514 RepID=A0A2A9E0S6_9MICO|nr:D-glycero-beta-D-manno-heptose 1-phosphate adenylyltransferase [Microbacterium agarici]PFG31799.1 rfaE bifunctional protein kinase chain/domain/rfaE bifunctional protein nucleotidyltransferase chain/domain [Microbacterium agarici]
MTAALTVDLVTELAATSPRVVVIGDLILDGWWDGQAERMSREAPVPVVEIAHRRFAAGGAANTAVNLAAMGAQVRVVGAIGNDDAGRRLRVILEEAGVDTRDIIETDATDTIAKNRIVSEDQVIVRLDDVSSAGYPASVLADVADAAARAAAWADAEVICDYGCGLLSAEVLEKLASREQRPRTCIVDAHDLSRTAALHPDVVTPNADECSGLCDGLDLDDRPGSVARCREAIIEASGARSAVVTLDREGSVVLGEDGSTHRTYAHPAHEQQASGAGDTFTAALSLALSCDVPLALAADLAQLAADIVVRMHGTSVCSSADLRSELSPSDDQASDVDELSAAVAEHRASGRRIVFTNGCFDVLHRGHTASLRQAKHLGDVLVVAINDDASVRRLKGPDRPVNSAADRAAVLAALECVDYVTVFSTDTPIPLLEQLKPDVYAKGGDYTPQMLEETAVVRGYGGTVHVLDYVESHSTSGVVEQIRDRRPTRATEPG